jgi:hypothetical protein
MSTQDIATLAKPTINALFEQTLTEAIPFEQLNVVLSTPPREDWVKVHPYIKNHKYLPIDKIEYLLRSCFKKFQIEVKEVKQLFNAIQVTVRVHYWNPASNEMMFHDGVGAWDLQTQSQSGPLKLDISNINIGAVPMATGIAKSVAIKDACDHFGSLFGANLNRKDVANFEGNQTLLGMAINPSDLIDLLELKKQSLTDDELAGAQRIINNKEVSNYSKLVNILKSK